jgi:PAS domain S-box-containing protein
MLVFDEAGCVLFYNQACERLFGHQPGRVVGQDIRMLMAPEFAAAAGDVASCFTSAGGSGDGCFQDSDGHRLTVDVSLSTASDTVGRQHLLVLRARGDACALPAPDSELARAARMSALEEISAAVVHKLNQPLTALTLYLQAIERVYSRETAGGVLPDLVLSILEKSANEAERASTMLQQLRQSLDHEDAAHVVKTTGAAGQSDAPKTVPEPLDEQSEHGGGSTVSHAIAKGHGGDLVVDSGERERETRSQPAPAAPERVSAPPVQEEQGKWVNV